MNLLQQIACTTHSMRIAQKEYFRTRSAQSLQASKELERNCDALLDQWWNEQQGIKQGNLFEQGGPQA
jgi:hypothetical protein